MMKVRNLNSRSLGQLLTFLLPQGYGSGSWADEMDDLPTVRKSSLYLSRF